MAIRGSGSTPRKRDVGVIGIALTHLRKLDDMLGDDRVGTVAPEEPRDKLREADGCSSQLFQSSHRQAPAPTNNWGSLSNTVGFGNRLNAQGRCPLISPLPEGVGAVPDSPAA
jgi:hypothetical protein